jgi:hypothetical protein
MHIGMYLLLEKVGSCIVLLQVAAAIVSFTTSLCYNASVLAILKNQTLSTVSLFKFISILPSNGKIYLPVEGRMEIKDQKTIQWRSDSQWQGYFIFRFKSNFSQKDVNEMGELRW